MSRNHAQARDEGAAPSPAEGKKGVLCAILVIFTRAFIEKAGASAMPDY
jgi:hypothetical protein